MSVQQFEVGSIVEGKITGIKPFGAFVALDEEKQGLVHISEVSHSYVKDIHDVLSVGETVKVKIKSIDEENGRISLSIRDTQAPPEHSERRPRQSAKRNQDNSKNNQGFNTLEDKLKEWLKQSNEIHAELNKRIRK